MNGKLVQLKDVVKWVRGLTYSKKDEVENNGTPVLRATNIDLVSHKIILDDIRQISKSVKIKDEKYIKKGDILICTASGSKKHLGKVALIEQNLNMAFGGFMSVLKCTQDCYSKFLYYILISNKFKKHLSSLNDGANINNLKFSQIEEYEFFLPSIIEQHRIVAKLDTAFAEIDNSTKAVENKINNTEILFQSYLKSVFDISGGNIIKETIGKVCEIRSGTTISSKLEKSKGELPYLKVADMNLILNKNSIKTSSRFVNKSDININSIIRKGSTIFPKRGGAIDTNKKRITDIDIVVDLNIMSAYPNNKLNPQLLYYYFLNLDMRKLGSGSSIRQINNYDIAPLFINFPKSLQKQKEIVGKISNIKTYCEKLINNYKLKKLELHSLKKSILKKTVYPELSNVAS